MPISFFPFFDSHGTSSSLALLLMTGATRTSSIVRTCAAGRGCRNKNKKASPDLGATGAHKKKDIVSLETSPTHVYTHVYMHMSIHMCIHMCINVSVHVSVYMSIHVHGYAYGHVYKQVHMHVHTCTRMSIRMSVHTSTHMSMHMFKHMSMSYLCTHKHDRQLLVCDWVPT